MGKHSYKKSFLNVINIILGSIFTVLTLYIISNYSRNIVIGSIISIAVTLLYIMALKKSASLYENQHIGGAYFLTIGGFFFG